MTVDLSIRPASRPGPRSWDWASLRAHCLGLATRLLPQPEAEEAVQEALVRAWRLSNGCRAPEMPLPWVLKITRNESLRLIERRARRLDHECCRVVRSVQATDDAELTVTTRVTVQQALLDLEQVDRDVLRLRYSDDLTQADVARRLGVPEGTVKVRLHRARNRLRAKLGETSEQI